MQRVLLTGATGFLGNHCLARLIETDAAEIHAVCRSGKGRELPRVTWHAADLRNPAEARALIQGIRPSHLLHGAWIATPGVYASSVENMAWLESSTALFAAFGAAGGKRVVGVGSSAEYDPDEMPCREDATRISPGSIYGACKHAASVALDAAARTFGFEAAWARVFLPYGPGDPAARLIPSVLAALLAKKSIPMTHGRQVRDFIYAPDAAAQLADLLQASATGPFNVGSGIGTSVRAVIEQLAAITDARECPQFGAIEMRAGEPSHLVADMTKVRDQVGLRTPTPLEEALQAIVAQALRQAI